MMMVRGVSNRSGRALAVAAAAALLATTAYGQYVQRNLVSDGGEGSVHAEHMDPNLLNPWGLVPNPTGPWWVANNHSGTSTLYDGEGVARSLVVNIPGLDTIGAPTGIVFNRSSEDFVVHDGNLSGAAAFIFAGEDGTITAWSPALPPPPPSTQAHRVVNNANAHAIYKGLALAESAATGPRLYATDFHNGHIDVFDSNFAPVTTNGGFADPNLPEGYAPFNVSAVNDRLLVTYALQDENGEDDLPGMGHGFIDEFDLDGTLVRRLESGGTLNSPWGIAVAPSDFGPLSGALLVGNFGDGRINAFDPTTGDSLGMLSDTSGNPLVIDGLWGLAFGNGNLAGPTNTLFFTAGTGGEEHGLFGSIAIPAPGAGVVSCLALLGIGRRRRAPWTAA